MDSRQWHVRAAALSAALLVLVFYGCAKRPSIAQLSAPPPSGTASSGIASGAPGGESGLGALAGEAAGQRGAATAANEGAGQRSAGMATAGAPPRASGPTAMGGLARASATAGPHATVNAGGRAGQNPGAGARVPAPGGVTEAAGGGTGGEARGVSSGSAQVGGPGAVGGASSGAAGQGAMQPGAVGQPAAQPGQTMVAAVQPPPSEFTETTALADIHFDFDKYDIRPDDAKTLDANADWLKANPKTRLLIEGHCDERGTNEYNLALGQHRATSTREYLVAQGVAAGRITTISYGEERPLCTEHTEECWAKNRRAHFLVKAE